MTNVESLFFEYMGMSSSDLDPALIPEHAVLSDEGATFYFSDGSAVMFPVDPETGEYDEEHWYDIADFLLQ